MGNMVPAAARQEAPDPLQGSERLADLIEFADVGELPDEGDQELETEELREALRLAEKEQEEAAAAAASKLEDKDILIDTHEDLGERSRRKSRFTLAGKSIYFLMTDRFARSGTGPMGAWNHTFCDLDSPNGMGGWCGGTFRGIISQLPYIKGMGFDCIWISPPIDAADYTGYFGRNFFKINKQWGTQRDLVLLSRYIHKLNMCLVVDIVTNHVTHLTNETVNGNAVPVVPFSRGEDYHQLNLTAGNDFEAYVGQPPPYASGGVNNPAANTALQEGVEAGRFTCGPDNPNVTYCSCFPGNREPQCPGFDPVLQAEGWFGNLGDLNQSSARVRSGLLRFAIGLRDAFKVDAIRLDTAIYQSREWLAYLQEKVGIEILGEATVNNLTYAGSFQHHRGSTVLKGLLNFPPFYWMAESFCSYYLLAPYGKYSEYQGTWSKDPPDLAQVGSVIEMQQTGGMYNDLDLLGNFADNHDEFSRLTHFCQEDSLRIKNLLTLVFLMRGIPIIYYGTEQGLTGHQLTKEESKNYTIPNGQYRVRESLWQTYFNRSTWQYRFIAKMNSVRREYSLGVGKMSIKNKTRTQLIFKRKPEDPLATSSAWVFINNLANSSKQEAVRYCPGPQPGKGGLWIDALSQQPAKLREGCYIADDALPKVLVQKRD